MDNAGETKKAEDALKFVEAYLAHPITKAVFDDSTNEQEKIIQLLTNVPINNIESFFAHFEAIGHLRGLRRGKAIILDKLEEVKDQLKETE